MLARGERKENINTFESRETRKKESKERRERPRWMVGEGEAGRGGGRGRSEKQCPYAFERNVFTSPIRFSSCAASGSFFAIACYVSNACDVAGRFYD